MTYVNPQEIKRQLTMLGKGNAQNTGKFLYAILQQINADPPAFQAAFETLELIRKPVFQCADKLEKAFTLAKFPLSPNFRKMAKLCVFLHYELARGYESLLTHPDNQDLSWQASLAQKALLSLGFVLLYMAQLGETVSSSLWRRHGAIFQQGSEQGWLLQNVHEPLIGNQISLSPMDQFKCNVVFMALLPTRFDPFSSRRLFDFLLHNKHLIATNETEKQNNIWALDLTRNNGPIPSTSDLPKDSTRLLFSFQLPEDLPLPSSMAEQLAHYAGTWASAQDYSIKRQVKEVWIGWTTIESEIDRYRSSKESDSGWLQVPDLELAPSSNGSDPHQGDSFPISKPGEKKHRSFLKRWVDFSLYSHKKNNFALLDADANLLERGDLVVLKMLDESLMLAMVRAIQPGMQINRTLYGLECFPGQVEKSLIQLPKQWLAMPGILIEERKELWLPPVKIKPASTLKAGEKTYTVTKLLEWGTDYCTYLLTH